VFFNFAKLARRGLSIHLFIKAPRPGDSEGTFSVPWASCHLLPLKGRGNPVKDTTSEFAAYVHTIPFKCWTSSREAV